MHINVNGGHSHAAPGASGLLDEVECDRAVKDALIAELSARGYETSDSTSEASDARAVLAEQARMCNSSGADLGVSIHLNAGGGTGVEVWYWEGSDSGYEYAKEISARLASALGLPNRGPKGTRNLYWLNTTTMTSILVEVCFVDRSEDYDAYNALGAQGVAKAIADGLVGESASTSGWQKDDTGTWWKWEDGTYPKAEWQEIDGYQYYFDDNGYLYTGWLEYKDNWYYLDPDGRMVTDWYIVDGLWFYFNSDGQMQTGWIEYNSNAYYCLTDSEGEHTLGAMVTGWYKPEGTWAYFDESGAMKRDTVACIDSKWYIFDKGGSLVTNVTFDDNGALQF